MFLVFSKNLLNYIRTVKVFNDLLLVDTQTMFFTDLYLDFSLINQHIGIFDLLLTLELAILTSKSFLSYFFRIEISYQRIIELIPLVWNPILNKWIIMAIICIAWMNHYAFQLIFIILIRLLYLILVFDVFLALGFSKVLSWVLF